MNDDVLLLGHKNAPIKTNGEIATKKEFFEFISKATKFYDDVSDEDITEYNKNVIYELYRSMGFTHKQAIAEIGH